MRCLARCTAARCVTLLLCVTALGMVPLVESTAPRQRYFLWETNLGEGFSMRRNTFLRAGVLVRKIQEVDTSGAQWTLVLPPMTSHGWVSTENGERTRGFLPWGRFLNVTEMRKVHPRIIEIDEYLRCVWNLSVITVASLLPAYTPSPCVPC